MNSKNKKSESENPMQSGKIKITRLAAAFMLTAHCLLPASSIATCAASYTWIQTAPNTIAFTNTSTGAANPSYTWTFGDSQSSNAFSPTHVYSAAGTYMVNLLMYDNNVWCNTVCYTITVTGNVNCVMTVSTQVTNATCSTCADGSVSSAVNGGTPPYSYLWSNGAITSSISGLLPGTYTVCVTDANNCTACCTSNVSCCIGGPCLAGFTWTQTANNIIAFTNTSTGGNSPGYWWNFGDNTSAQTQNPVHTYNAPGTYWACLYMYDNNMLCYTWCDSVTVTGVVINNNTCSANFTLFPDSIILHQYWAVNLATGTPPFTYLWTWGDNSPPDTIPYPSHTYAAAGFYTICLTITDATGCTDTYCCNYQIFRMDAGNAMIYVNVVASFPTVISENQHQNISVYPNPAGDELYVIGNPSIDGRKGSVEIYDVMGEKRLTPALPRNTGQVSKGEGVRIDVSSLAAGIYFVRMRGDKGIAAGKFVKE